MKDSNGAQEPFTQAQVQNRDLVIKMLQYEEELATGDEGQQRYKDPFSGTSLDTEYSFHRQTLHHFGFEPSDESVANYRTIFKTYFKDPDNYDHEVINSSYYMRNNRCVFYRSKPLTAGDTLPNCRLYMLDGYTETDLHSAMRGKNARAAVICAYSNS